MKIRISIAFLLFGLPICPLSAVGDGKGEITLEGYFFKRADDTILHVAMEGTRMVFNLLDENHQPAENVFTHGTMRIDQKGKGNQRVAIRPYGEEGTLRGNEVIQKPHIMKVFARLFKGEEDSTGEVFNFLYNQHTLEEAKVTPLPDKQ